MNIIKPKNLKISLFLIVFLSVRLGFSQQETISLEESIKAALNYSNDLKTGNLRVEEAEAAKKEAFANYFPSIELSGVGMYGFDDLIPPMPGIMEIGIDNLYFASATASEVLYAGGRINNHNNLADLQVGANKIRAGQARDSVILQTEKKYWGLVHLQEQQHVLHSNETYLNQLLKQQQDLLDAGLIAKNDLLRVKVTLSQLKLQKSKLNNSHKIAILDFALYTGIAYDTTMVAMDKFPDVVPPQIKYGSPDLSIISNTNYQLLEKAVTASKLQTDVERANLLPTISVGLSGSQLGAFDGSFESSFIPVAFGMVSIPISDWWGAGRQKLKQQKIREEIAVNNLKNGEDELQVMIMKSWYDLTDAYKQVVYAGENMHLAEENLHVSRDNYDSGLVNLSDLLDAQRILQEAETELVAAYANYEEQKSTYLYHTNQIEIPE